MPLGVGVIGAGFAGAMHARSALGLDDVRVVAVAALPLDQAAALAKECGARVATAEEICAAPDVDLVVVATPTHLHAEYAMAAAKAGKHVFVEKPLGLSRADSERAVAACAEHKVTLAVGYNWRFQPALREVKRMLQDGRLGKLLHIEGNFCGPSAYRFRREHWRQDRDETPAGGMTGRGVHVVDAMLYLAGRIGSVTAQSARQVQDFGADDTTSMLFRFASGASGYLGTVIATAETWRMQVFGSNGWAEVGDVEHLQTWELRTCFIDRDNLATKNKPQQARFPVVSTERAELEHFANAAKERRPLAVPGGDELHNVAVLEAIVKSAQEGTRVSI